MKRSGGFTLIEVLVVLTLLGLLMMVLFGGFRAGIRSWHLAEQHTARVEEPRQLSGLLYRHLGQLFPATFIGDQNGQVEPAFVGDAHRMRYVAPLSMSSGSVPYLFEWVSNLQGRGGIWGRFAPYAPGSTPEDILAGAEFKQLSASTEASFAYFKSSDDPAEQGWIDVYAEKDPPNLVSVRLTSSDTPWPVLTFEVLQLSNETPGTLRFVR